ncbi:putative leader peptide [Streptomyces sp. SM12]
MSSESLLRPGLTRRRVVDLCRVAGSLCRRPA